MIRIGWTPQPQYNGDYQLNAWGGPHPMILHTNWRGKVDAAATARGRPMPCQLPLGCPVIRFTAAPLQGVPPEEPLMLNQAREEWLIVILASELLLAAVPKSHTGKFRFSDVEFVSPDGDFLPAFYDRLVDSGHGLIGIRVNPVSDSASTWLESVPTQPYLHVADGFVDIFLIGNAMPDAESTGDQAFGGQIFSSKEGDVALSIDVNYLCSSESDYAAIRNAKAQWMQVELLR